ncbi:hypothetical protein QBC34DRAFT_143339 [Podospora aff. communis PSN243]|uniref:Uncharacterized protein n=1 Tax=Podospora aff. communis PSN243 TaxID=3040156 RepID=A0AAV9GG34_9PEZI|nr:hypothetical protein QBC34DRAFT_143339 [Podospora aff. communis PSN243]
MPGLSLRPLLRPASMPRKPSVIQLTLETRYNVLLSEKTKNGAEVSSLQTCCRRRCGFTQSIFHRRLSYSRRSRPYAQDEFDIMAMVFNDQHRVLAVMDKTFVPMSNNRPWRAAPPGKSLPAAESPQAYSMDSSPSESADIKMPKEQPVWTSGSLPLEEVVDKVLDAEEASPDDNPELSQKEWLSMAMEDRVRNTRMARPFGSQQYHLPFVHGNSVASVYPGWETSGTAASTSLPLAAVKESMDDIARMNERASKAFNALHFLVDLKQKQSSVIDSRSACIQAEESLKVTQETKRQGKTITVFTIVTIVFLPMSFMAAFFAINIAQFPQDEDGNLSLGFVSQIMFPVSAAITAALIYIAFKVESIERGWQQAMNTVGALVTAVPRLWEGPRTAETTEEEAVERTDRTEQGTSFVRRFVGIRRRQAGYAGGGGAEASA